MQGKRVDRVGALVQQEMSRLIVERTRDPRIGFVTVTHVKMTPDLKSAVVFVSVLGDEKGKLSSIAGLEHARGFFQREIGESLKLRFTPRIQFELDRSLERGLEIDRILRDVLPSGTEAQSEEENPEAEKQ
ncbi:MAG TPA: 30S ribosome-binding factor RbfA [Candidatus Omnitrophica bacterium]|nr:30S ribosome-binding factor RbfA [Candidatus Omnitrophota bacterium]